jgi:epoxyqueuosine reductase QueG
MNEDALELGQAITDCIRQQVQEAEGVTAYREPLIGFASAHDPRFLELREVVHPSHMMPQDLLPGASSVVSFFLPFVPSIVEANARQREEVAREWAVAYVETNKLIGQITGHLIEVLGGQGIRAAAEPATHNFDPETLVSRWAHKSVAVIAGLGSFGLHQLVITDAGCAGRFGSLVVDSELPSSLSEPVERCLFHHDGSCLECVTRCPVGALDASEPLDKQVCWRRCQAVAEAFAEVGRADVCGKCAIGPCSFGSAGE